MMEPFVVCENLVKIYQVAALEVVALQGLDLTVERGEFLGLIGASGSGKSTLLNLIGGLDRPSAGRLTVAGQNLLQLADRALDRYRRLQVGFVWQQTARNLVPYLSAQENVELPLTLAGAGLREKRARSRTLLEMIGLWPERRRRLAHLSGGQQQRVAIAVALANQPQLLLADEPTGELDSATAGEVLALLRCLTRECGLTTLIVTHDPQVARSVDRAITIKNGRASSEAVRRASDVEAALTRPGDAVPEAEKDFTEYAVVDRSGQLQLPSEMLAQAGITDRAAISLLDDGILVRPVRSQGAKAGRRWRRNR